MLDAVAPPLGFGQYQSIDLSGSRGRRRLATLDHLAETISGFAEANPALHEAAPKPPVPKPQIYRSRGFIFLLIAAFLSMGAFGAWRMLGRGHESPTVKVAAADHSQATLRLARDLTVMLGSLQSVKDKSMRLLDNGGKTSVGADLIFEASANSRQPEASLVLYSGNDRTILWARDFKPPSGNPSDLKQQLTHTAGRVLDCALDTFGSDGKRLKPQTRALYLNGCAQFAELIGTNTTRVIPLFLKVTEEAPWFEPGWAKLLLAETSITGWPFVAQDLTTDRRIRQHIKQARSLNPRLAEAALAEINLLPSTSLVERTKLIDQALAAEPDNATLLASRSKLHVSVGLWNNAVQDSKRASQLEPLSPAFRHAYISVLAHAGQLEAAFAELEKAERLWPGASNMIDARFRLHIFYGNPREALRLLRTGATDFPFSIEPVLTTKIDPSAVNLARARDLVRFSLRQNISNPTGPVQGYADFGIEDELYSVLDPLIHTDPEVFAVLFRPTFRTFRSDTRFIQLAARFGLVNYWKKTSKWPDFCLAPELPYDCKIEAAKINLN